MKEIPLISVIVPVYKAEAYLDRCIESLVKQTYGKLEIILVDDGSPDACPQICDAWAAKEPRIRVIHKENGGGGGEARNMGLREAKGSFIGFVDSDDYISEDFYAYLYSMMDDDVDIAECGYLLTEDETACFDNPENDERRVFCERQAAFEHHLHDRIFRQLVWNKLYRVSVVQNVFFPVGKKIDDEFWTYRAIGNARKLVHSDARLYAYRQQPYSVTHQLYSMDRLQAIEAKYERVLYVKNEFPALLSLAKRSVWFGCMYQGQIALDSGNPQQICHAFSILHQYYMACRMRWADLADLNAKHKIWVLLGKVSLRMTCFIRNALKIGL